LLAIAIEPEVKYAKSGSVHIAYQVFGEGPVNLVATPGAVSHLDYYWKYPGQRRFLEGLGKFARVAIFDKRGTGLSDREGGAPTFEQRMDDIRAVMDAAKFETAVLMGISEGVAMSILFAASYPRRTRGLILYGGSARGLWAPDYPWAMTKEQWEEYFERTERTWGTKEWEERIALPGRDESFIRWLIGMRRMGASPGATLALGRSEMNMDVRGILPTIHISTLVLHRVGDSIEEGRYLATHIPGAQIVELPGSEHIFTVETQITDKILHEIQAFALEVRPMAEIDRMLTTALFVDIVNSTMKVADIGDAKWKSFLDRFYAMIRNEVQRYNGLVIKSTGDGFLATFDGPTRAIRCASAVTRASGDLGVGVRAGIHTGECIMSPTDVSGIAIHIASRVLDEASAGEVLVTGTVRDLVYGSGISFEDRGEHQFKGIEEKRHLYSVINAS
jgi:class 3 adenylate cyclase